jgi:hypothetical protein
MRMNVTERHRTILSAGVDWLTCSKSGFALGSEFGRLGDELVRGAKEAGTRTRLAILHGYAGLRGDNFFFGHHGGDALVTLSGPHNPALICDFIQASDNVSRLDLQITVEHTPPEPDLGRINFLQLVEHDTRPGVKPVVTTMYDTKGGHTNAVGARISDSYGRNYDKGVEGKLCEPGRLWRYEIEFKRGRAKKIARQIALSRKVTEDVARSVWAWWSSRGVLPVYQEPRGCLIDTRLPERAEADYLRYFESNVATSVRTAIGLHGIHSVLRALGLLNQVEVLCDAKEE